MGNFVILAGQCPLNCSDYAHTVGSRKLGH